MEKVKYIKDIRIIREKTDPDIMTIKAKGITRLNPLFSPLLISAKEYPKPSDDGIYELDFILGSSGEENLDVEIELDVVYKFKKVPDWIKGIKINAAENSDIELI